MSKMVTWISIMSGLMLLFYFGGILPQSTVSGAILSMALNPQNIENSSFVLKISAVLSIVSLIGAVIVSRFPYGDFYLIYPIVGVILSFGYDFLQIYQSFAAYSPVAGFVAVMIFGPLMMMFVISVVEWWRGVNP